MITGVIKGQEGFHWCPVRNLCLLMFQMVIDQTPLSQLLDTLGEAALSTSPPSVPWPKLSGPHGVYYRAVYSDGIIWGLEGRVDSHLS